MIKIRVTVTAEVVDADALTDAALTVIDNTAAQSTDPEEKAALDDLRAAVPEDPSAAIVALVDPEAPLLELPGVEFVGLDVEVGPELDQAIELP
ncbi:MAG TPA: hypothetical protein VNQ77_02225 [Frankiaceae bacterium]|nr:hypothetical protein [Frankiaceae bacterium]